MLQRIRDLKKSRRGFTLVEIIVVLVILAILAAFTIPAMLGFVNDARGKAAIAEAREVYVAAQSATTSAAAVTSNITSGSATDGSTNVLNNSGIAALKSQMKNYLNGDINLSDNGANITVDVGKKIDTTDSTKSTIAVGSTAIKAAVTDKTTANIHIYTGLGAEAGKVLQVVYLDKSGKYVCSIVANADGTAAEFFTK